MTENVRLSERRWEEDLFMVLDKVKVVGVENNAKEVNNGAELLTRRGIIFINGRFCVCVLIGDT